MTQEQIDEAIAWHQKKAQQYEEWAEAERRNAEAYRTGKITMTVVEALRS